MNALRTAEILLPRPGIDLSKWAVVACDQFTAQPEYWQAVEDYVGDAPSTLRVTLPEVWLNEAETRIPAIHAAMREYLDGGLWQTAVKQGFVLVCRETESGVRPGLLVSLDLEQYDFTPGAESLIRPTEGTVVSRVPPRARIRAGAPVELPHVMMLHDAEQGIRQPGNRVLICGGGSAGLECALSLRRRGHSVVVADLLPEEQFAAGMPYLPRLDLLQSLKREGVTLLPEHRILRFTPEGAVLSSPEGETLLSADSCVIAMGVRPRRELLEQLQTRYAQGVIPVGDCEGGTNLYDATHTAFFGALRVL